MAGQAGTEKFFVVGPAPTKMRKLISRSSYLFDFRIQRSNFVQDVLWDEVAAIAMPVNGDSFLKCGLNTNSHKFVCVYTPQEVRCPQQTTKNDAKKKLDVRPLDDQTANRLELARCQLCVL